MDRRFPPGDGDERTTLTGWLDWQRATVWRKVEGLSDVDAHRSLLPTSPATTVSGVVSHLRWVEWGWFSRSFPSTTTTPGIVGPPETGEWGVAGRPVAELLGEYAVACADSRTIIAATALDAVQEFTPAEFTPVTLRWIVTHMIDETARHLGHLDILREMLDGTRSY